MTTAQHRFRMAQFARISHRKAELLALQAELAAEEAALFNELADGEVVNIQTGRRVPKTHVPEIKPVNDVELARARAALNDNRLRRRSK